MISTKTQKEAPKAYRFLQHYSSLDLMCDTGTYSLNAFKQDCVHENKTWRRTTWTYNASIVAFTEEKRKTKNLKVMFRQPIWLTLIHSGPTHCSHYSSEKVTWTEGEVMETNQKHFHNGEKWRFKSVTAVRQYYPFSSMLTSTIPLTIWTYWNLLQYHLSPSCCP